jgi:aminopeptidase N
MSAAQPKTIHLRDYRPPSHLIDSVDLRFDLRESGTRVIATLHMRKNPDSASSDSLRLQGEELTLKAIRLDGVALDESAYELDDASLTLRNLPNEFSLYTEVEIAPESNTALEGLYRSNTMFCTQCEAEGFRKITYFLDRPDVLSRFKVRIEADKASYPVLLSNGDPCETGELADGRHFAEWKDPVPKPCYLFALVAGDLKYVEDHHTTPSGREVAVRVYVEPENIEKCDHALRSLINAMRWDEKVYGREYDLSIYNVVAVNDFNMGAMENKGLNIFNSKFVLAKPDTATDIDYQGIEGVIGHEYFHNWTGNRITCRDWFQLSLKEGFTVYRDQEFSADMGAGQVKRIEDVRLLRAHQFTEDASPMAHPIRPSSYIEINNFYTATVYEKGAEVVRMQANLLGPDTFRKATDLYFDRHDGQAVTTEDFVACMEDASGNDLTQFKHWYNYAGTPKVSVKTHYDAQAKTYALTISQSLDVKPTEAKAPAFHIPFAMGLLDQQGSDLDLTWKDKTSVNGTLMLELKAEHEAFTFHGIEHEPVPSFLRGFSAPVRLEYDYTDEQLLHLMAFDSDGFARWDAAQTLWTKHLLAFVKEHQAGRPMQLGSTIIDALRKMLADTEGKEALIGEVLSLPSFGYLCDLMDVVDVDALMAALDAMRHFIAHDLAGEFKGLYAKLTQSEMALTPEAMAKRSLRNTLLRYLAVYGEDKYLELAHDQYQQQANMTDVMTAMSCLADSTHAKRNDVLNDFAQRWAADALVMDKWFAVQASADRADVLDQVKALQSHAAFSMKNPNKVRSLIGAFVNANPRAFHAADGSGYEFLVDNVLVLDKTNPQIAARLLRTMSRWQRYDAKRQALMKSGLQRIKNADVSRDVFEIAATSLG